MGQTAAPPLMFMLILIGLLLACLNSAASQNACSSNDTVVINFPEMDPPNNPNQGDPRYTKAVLTNGIEPYLVNISKDPQFITELYPFDTYFNKMYNPVTKNYEVIMKAGINRDGNNFGTDDDVNILKYQMRCYPTDLTDSVYLVLKIYILDINDNTPQFVNVPYTVDVNELTPVGVTIFRGISANDNDEGPNKQITYSLSYTVPSQFNFSGTQFFILPSDAEGLVSVFAPLDFESMLRTTGDSSLTYYNITVTARDNALDVTQRRSSTTTMIVKILDNDDQGPQFVYPSCINSSQLYGKSCIRPKYLTSIPAGNSSSIPLVFRPDPSDPKNPNEIVEILMQDMDTLNSPVTCVIRRTEPAGYEGYFSAVASFASGKQYRCSITKIAGQSLSRASFTQLEIVVEAIEQSSNFRVDYATVVATLTQTNTFPPTITSNSNNNIGYIYESAPAGSLLSSDQTTTTLFMLTFQDADVAGTDPPAQYDITVGGTTPFTVTPAGYVQLVTATLDYETVRQYILPVTITDRTPERRTATTTVTLTVLDINDNRPVMTSTNYVTNVPQGDYTSSPRLLVTVTANDADFGPVQYRLSRAVAGNTIATSKFSVALATGGLSLQGSVVAGEVYTVYVNVSDQGNPLLSTEAVVIVTVDPIVNRSPQFSANNYVIYISEGVSLNSVLFYLPVTDSDTPITSLQFTLSNENPAQNPGSSFFSTNSTALTNLRYFDRETIPQHNVTATARDPEGNSAQAIITVIITDINDNDPVFGQNSYTFSVQENQPVATSVGRVTATDRDEPSTPNSAVYYGIVPVLDFGSFVIDASNGQLNTNAVFDYETKKQYQILVRAFDGGLGNRTAVVPVTINILDLQDSVPLFEDTTREVSVYENVQNDFVVNLTATDADSTPNYNFVLRNFGANNDALTFNVQTVGNHAVITVNGALDYETKNRYQFLVTTQDGSSSTALFTTATVIVNVLDVNDFSPALQPFSSSLTVRENVPGGRVLITLSATDADGTAPNNVLFYSLQSTSPTVTTDLFYIGPQNGALTVARSLQAERGSDVYTVVARVSDFGLNPSPRSVSGTVTVTIVRNRAPTFANNAYNLPAIDETQQVNSVIATITATDPDTGVTPEFAGVTYSLVADSRTRTYVQVDLSSGAIRLASSLIGSTDSSFTFQLIATDLGGLTNTTTVTIPINKNLYSPEFTQLPYTVTIPENYAQGDSVVQLLAQDHDATSPWKDLSFTITSDALSQQYYQISDSGLLTLRRTLVSTNISEFNMVVSVSDKGNPPRTSVNTATVKVIVTRNQQSPIFFNETYRVTIPETQPVSSNIISVSATDADSIFNKLTYYIEGDQTAAAYFNINPLNGSITLRQDLRSTPISSFVIRVAALDDGPQTRRGSALVFVDVTRNFNRPNWILGLPSAYTVLETAPVGFAVGKVSAIDSDSQAPNNQIEYVVTSSGDFFQVNHTTGDITVKIPVYLDPTNAISYPIVLIARDKGTPVLQSDPFTVTITPIRDQYAPVWQNTPYNFQVTLPLSNNQLISTLTATDSDLAPFNQMTFDVLPYNGSPLFIFANPTATTVEIRAPSDASAINSDNRPQHFFYAQVRDNGLPQKFDIDLVTITVNNNRNGPSFTTTSKTITITENETPGSILTNCTATDSDSGNNGVVVYSNSLTATNALPYFGVIESNSNIVLQRDLHEDRSTLQYIVVITARDSGTSPLPASNTCTVTIVVNRNQYAPVFINTPYDKALPRTAGIGQSVVTVTATDADTVIPFNLVSYEIVRQSVDGAFIINPSSGLISVNAALGQSTYTIAVRAYDGGKPSLSAYNVFTVTVNGNLEDPRFTTPAGNSYSATTEVLENIKLNDTVFTVSATDGDIGDAGRVSYYLVGNNQAAMYFQVNPDNGVIKTRTSLLQDTALQYVLYIIARDNDPSPRQAANTATVTVNVHRNTFTPQFNGQLCNNVINENLAVGQSVTSVTATDADRQNTFETVIYELIGDGDALGFFQLSNRLSGSVSLRSSLSGTAATILYLRIGAKDNGEPPKSSTTSCTITVNKNLFPPVWTGVNDPNNPSYLFTINEDQQVFAPFGQLSATDADSQAPNNQFEFELLSGTVDDGSLICFAIDPTTGFIFAKRSLRESPCTAATYKLRVRANDKGSYTLRSNPSSVTINVVRNQNSPTWNLKAYSFTIPMNLTATSVVGIITASDLDPLVPYGTLSYSVIGGGNGNSYFTISAIHNNNVNVILSNQVLATTVLEYKIFVLVQDSGLPPLQDLTEVTIYVNRNLNRPYFTQIIYNFEINEDYPVGDLIGTTLLGADNDQFSPWKDYYFRPLPIHPFFTVSTSGGVSAHRDLRLDANQADSYTLTAQIYDGGNPSLTGTQTATVNVHVYRNGNCSSFTNMPQNITVNESATGLAYTVSTVDDEAYVKVIAYDIRSLCVEAQLNITLLRNKSTNNMTCDLAVSDPNTVATVIAFLQDADVINHLELDKDAMNSTPSCVITKTEPAGFESFFIAKLSPVMGQLHRCSINKVTGVNWSKFNFTQLEIAVEIRQESVNAQMNLTTVIKLNKSSFKQIASDCSNPCLIPWIYQK